MAGAAAHAGQAALATRYAAGAGVLAAGAAAHTRDAALAAGSAAGTVELASRAAVSVGVAASAARVLLERDVGRRGSGDGNVSNGRGAAAIAAATAPATTSGFMSVNFDSMRLAYHLNTCPKHRE